MLHTCPATLLSSNPSTGQTPFALLLIVLTTLGHLPFGSDAFVIAPPWANPDRNPCSTSSWQLVYWPPSHQCYKIFSQGPCPPTQELAYHADKRQTVCRCPQDLPILWPETGRCYPRYNRGPCPVGYYLDFSDEWEAIASEVNGTAAAAATCKENKRCAPGEVFWPPDNICHEVYTQGPCHKGDLLIINPSTAEPYCGCDSYLLKQYFYAPLGLCYEQLTRGPCESGLLFTYNHTLDRTECTCSTDSPNYFPSLGQCFPVEDKGPCETGQIFRYDKRLGRARCQCREQYVYWEPSNSCYKEFTPGPCKSTQFIVKGRDGFGHCMKNPCPKTDLYFPKIENSAEGECHKVGNRGPCPEGELVIFEAYSGKSFQGDCGCNEGYNQNYWPDTGKCYEWYRQGPCQSSFLFRYNKEDKRTECVCDTASGYVFWNETGGCYKAFTQGPCPDNAILIPNGENQEVFCECLDGYTFNPEDYTCRANFRLSSLDRVRLVGGHHRLSSLWSSMAQFAGRRGDLAEKSGATSRDSSAALADPRLNKDSKKESPAPQFDGALLTEELENQSPEAGSDDALVDESAVEERDDFLVRVRSRSTNVRSLRRPTEATRRRTWSKKSIT